MRPRRSLVAAGVVVIVGAGAALALRATSHSSGSSASAASPTTVAAPTNTTRITRRDLVDSTTVSGTVTFGDTRALRVAGASSSSSSSSSSSASSARGTANSSATSASTSSSSNVITALPAVGTVISLGQTVFEVDGAPGPALLYGARPMWRTLQNGVDDGVDVAQLEYNLAVLGYTDNGNMTVDDHFSSATTAAVEAWQTARGLTANGVVQPSDIVYEPGAVRVASLTASLGDSASGEIMQVTDTTELVHVALDPTDSSFVKIGAPVSVTLADNRVVSGVYYSLGSVATTSSSGGGGGGGNTSTTVDLWIAFPKLPSGLLDQEPVSAALVTDRAANVLSVPTSALLALSEGGYALQVVQPDGSTKLVGVQTGKFAGGFVQVSGAISEGQRVVTA
jgi:peptidoglycan hydrolase-like protein with peptidoglycan-binding domain